MNRRDAIKWLLAGMGSALTVSQVEAGWAAVTTDKQQALSQPWQFFTEEEALMSRELGELMLPTEDLSLIDPNQLIQFVDYALKHVIEPWQQTCFRQGAVVFETSLLKKRGVTSNNASGEDYLILLQSSLQLSSSENEQILKTYEQRPDSIKAEKRDTYLFYQYLLTLRKLFILGFYTSESVSKDLLNYLPVPGQYDPCLDLSEVEQGHSWAL